jgi:hypothetical protein
MSRVHRSIAALLAVALAACSGADASETAAATEATTTTEAKVFVPADETASVFNANVVFTADGVDPEILFLPAGHPVRLAFRNRTPDERHYRVAGLVADEVRWLLEPEYTLFDLEQMTPEEQAEIGFDPTKSDEEHFLHHMAPSLTAMVDESPEGVQPLPGEVHAYTTGHATELITFYPVMTGRYEVQDVLSGETIGTVIVFAANE